MKIGIERHQTGNLIPTIYTGVITVFPFTHKIYTISPYPAFLNAITSRQVGTTDVNQSFVRRAITRVIPERIYYIVNIQFYIVAI